jgi:peptidoglycan hydrolase-like protein with peptidoglycan-binding domain
MLRRLALSLAMTASTFFGTAASAESLAPLQIFVSKDRQSLAVYEGDQLLTTSKVSTGKQGHTTPSGIFSIIEKKKTHFSNLYDDAPMPYMQRVTWSGIALHESANVPSYPASHGCVRMPRAFAKELYGMTRRGFHVIITDREVAPRAAIGADLFMPRVAPPEPDLLSDAVMRPAMESSLSGDKSVEVAMSETLPKLGAQAVAALARDVGSVKILISRATEKQKMKDAQAMLARLGYYDGPIDGSIGTKSRDAIRAYQQVHSQRPTGVMDEAFLISIHKVMNKKPLTGWLSVRRNFRPVFDLAVDIDQPEVALGTHFFTAMRVNAAQNKADWFTVSIDNHIPTSAMKRMGITTSADTSAEQAAEDAFKRIAIPAETRAKIETMLGNGSSMTITDNGTEAETGQGTDFITVTRAMPRL